MTRIEQRQARLLVGMTQAELAQRLGVSQGCVSRWEQKDQAPLWLRTWWRGFQTEQLELSQQLGE